jgi:hypothetical protein
VGKVLWAHARVNVAPTTATTIGLTIQTHEDTGFSTGTINYELIPAQAINLLTLGLKFDRPLPAQCNEQYVRGLFTVTGSTEGTGAFDVWIDDQPQAENSPWSKDPGNQVYVSNVGNP